MLNSLQVARALAALLVVLHHTSGSIFHLPKYFGYKPFDILFEFGFVSVDFFFVLSGFVIMHVHARDIGQPGALGSYLGKRFTRAYLPYWIVLFTILPVYFLMPSLGQGHETDPDVVVRSIALFPHPQSAVVLVVAWTMVFEVFFYLVFALLILNKRLGMAVMAVWTVGVLAYPWFESYPWNFVFSPWHLRTLAGLGAAIVLKRCTIPTPRTIAVLGLGLALATSMYQTFIAPLPLFLLIAGCTLGSATAIVGLAQADRSGLLWSPRSLMYLGNATYAIYLVHFPALSLLAKLAKLGQLDAYLPGPVLFWLIALSAIGIGCLFHQFIEHPLHSFTKGFFRRAPAPASNPAFANAAIQPDTPAVAA